MEKNIGNTIKGILATAYNHKIKVAFLFTSLYLLKKAYDFYQFIKPFLQLKNQLSQGGADSQEQEPATESLKALNNLTKSYPDLKQQLKIFKSTIKNINMTMMHQPKYLNENLIEVYHDLKKVKEGTQESGISNQEKMQRWNNLKVVLFQQLFTQLYCSRIVNLITTYQLSLTGQRYYIQDQKIKGKGQKERQNGGLLSLLDDDNNEDENEEIQNDEDVQQREQQAQEEMKQYQEACEQFMSLAFTNIVKKAFEEHIFPQMSDIIEQVMRGVDIKQKYGLKEIEGILDQIHQRIMRQLFRQEPKTAPDSLEVDNSFESSDSQDQIKNKTIWLVERFVDEFKHCEPVFAGNSKLKSLIDEFIDLMEVDYFESIIYELLDLSYKKNLRNYIITMLSTPQGDSQNAIINGPDDKVHLAKIITELYVLQQNNCFINQLKDFDFMELQEPLEQIIKLIYFEDEAFQEVEMKDLIEGSEQRGGAAGLMGGLENLLQNQNLEGLLQMFENAQ